MQSELLTEIRTFIRGIETPRRYSAWKHGDSEVEIALHLQDGKEHHLGYVSTTQEAALVTIIATLRAMVHGTTDMIDQLALAAAVELLEDMDVEGVQILTTDEETDSSIN